ncbi:helix-turn-helix domain-containing protein [Paenibacillus sp. PAMC21692]|uniref:helix-turn-helix domain-containing protein n=1 Tax=Paenibacillus sp. PAMC21692 TaxID=2762320 RepID=UPI00164CF1C1|nr:helix-turn-helix domain-containing protein [Paenibacillus sp. PAMC21692]QNK58806.1 helix-turn-helix domain-containing protein [Paenibacillus sp. PAMC21692]
MKGKSIYVRSVIYMITLISLVVLIGCSFYYISVRSLVLQEVTDSDSQLTAQMASTYEVFLDSTINAAMVSIQAEESKGFGEQSSPTSQSRYIYEKLGQISQISNFIYSVYYTNIRSEEVYVSSGFRFDKSDFYDGDWLGTLETESDFYILPARKLPTLPHGEKDVIPIVINMPLHALQHDHTYIINLDAGRLFQYLLQHSDNSEGRNIRIVEPTGMIFVSTDRPQYNYRNVTEFPYLKSEELMKEQSGHFLTSRDGQKLMISHFTSPQFGWKYISETNYDDFAKSMVFPLQIIIAIAAISLVISIIVVTSMSKWLYKPVKDIIRMLGGQTGKEKHVDEYKWIISHIQAYLKENEHLRETVDQNQSIMEKHFLHTLIVRNTYKEQEIAERLDYFGYPLYLNYTVVVIGIDEFDEYMTRFSMEDRILWEYAIENITLELLERHGAGFFVSLDTSKFALVYSLINDVPQEELTANLIKLTSEIKESIHYYLKLSVSIGVGRAKPKAGHLYKSYQEALTALKYAESIGNGELVSYREMQGAERELDYPYELEQTMTQHVMLGQYEEAEGAVAQIFRLLQTVPNPQASHRHMISFQILNALTRKMFELDIPESSVLQGENGLAELCKELLQNRSDQASIDMLLGLIHRLCLYIQERRDNVSNSHVREMMAYIREHLAEPISVDSAADHVGLNRMYAGRLFKQYTNQNMADYMNQTRIDKATELLSDTNMKVMDIATAVGFNNTHYFIKIFKRYKGMTPGKFKENTQA